MQSRSSTQSNKALGKLPIIYSFKPRPDAQKRVLSPRTEKKTHLPDVLAVPVDSQNV